MSPRESRPAGGRHPETTAKRSRHSVDVEPDKSQHRRPGCTCRVLRTVAPNRAMRRAGYTLIELHGDGCPHGDDWGGRKSWQSAGKVRSPFRAVSRG